MLHYAVIHAAKLYPKGDETTKKIFAIWAEESKRLIERLTKNKAWVHIEVELAYLEMQYQVGLISRDEVLALLDQVRQVLSGRPEETEELQEKWLHLIDSITHDKLKVVVQ